MSFAANIPTQLIAARVYDENNMALLGVAKIDLPSFEAMSTTVSGIGILGEIDMPTKGSFGSMTTTLTWRTLDPNSVALIASESHKLDVRTVQQVYDSAGVSLGEQNVRITLTGITKTSELGGTEPSNTTDSSNELEVVAIRIWIGGIEYLHLDKFNFIFKVKGKDILAKIRAGLGIIG